MQSNGVDPDASQSVRIILGPHCLWTIPLSHDCPVALLERSILAAQILDTTAKEFGFDIQHGEGKKELLVVLRGAGRAAALARLQSVSVGDSFERTPKTTSSRTWQSFPCSAHV